MDCPKCRFRNIDDASFCGRCGVVLPNPPHPDDDTHGRAEGFCTRCGQARPKSLPGKSSGPTKIRKPLLWLLAVTVLAWGGVMAWHFLSHEFYLNMKFVIVPQGCFQMGSDENPREAPRHETCLDWFYLSQYEVTQAQWESVMGENPSLIKGCGADCPVNGVSWEQIQIFIRKLNDLSATRYRLPTEAEWEYACRGGATQRYCGSDDPDLVAWLKGNARDDIHPVGQLAPNAFHLYDMSGNVWEWVSDRHDEAYYAQAPKRNPKGPESGPTRIFRGGSIKSNSEFTHPTQRNHGDPRTSFGDLGFRLVKIP
ncbi:MAG: SUMF1/EgtB/PvdO family nonheme iron enzyme [Magnetococcales bacterium]|nr:SUMF1/EgtB/PvdO family nonheme iron enzyme [Magnetococcales bacterium]